MPAGQSKRRVESSRAHRAVYEDAMNQLRRIKREGGDLDSQEKTVLRAEEKKKKQKNTEIRKATGEVYGKAMKELRRKKRRGEKLDAQEKAALATFAKTKRVSLSETYAQAQKDIDFQEAMEAKTIDEFVDANQKRLNKISSEERRQMRKDAVVNKRIKAGDLNLPSRKDMRKALPEIVERSKKDSGQPMSRAEYLQQSVADLFSELDRRVAAEMNRAQRDGTALTPELNVEMRKKIASETLKGLQKIDSNITAELTQFEDEAEITDAERELETLAERLYKEMDIVERIAAGEDLETPDPTEFDRGVTLLSAHDVEPGLPPTADESQTSSGPEITPQMPDAFLEEDPAILAAQEKQVREIEAQLTEKMEAIALNDEQESTQITSDAQVEIPGSDEEKAAKRQSFFEAIPVPQETMQQFGFSWQFDNPEIKEVKLDKLDLEMPTYMKSNSSEMKKIRTELFGLYGFDPKEAVFEQTPEGNRIIPEKRPLAFLDSKQSVLEAHQAMYVRAHAELNRLITFNKEYRDTGLLPTAYMKAELVAARDLVFKKRSEYNFAAAEYNDAFASVLYNKDKKRGLEVYYKNSRDALANASQVLNDVNATSEKLRPIYEAGNAQGSEVLLNQARSYFQYAERRVSDLIDIQRNSPFGEGSSEFVRLNKILLDISSRKAELAAFEYDNSFHAQLSESEFGDIMLQTLGEYTDPESVDQIARAISTEMAGRYGNISNEKELTAEQSELAIEYRNRRNEIKDLRQTLKNAESALRNLGYDRGTSEGDFLNRNIFSHINRWIARKTVNTSEGGLDIAAFRQINELSSDYISNDVISQLESGNISMAGIDELVRAKDFVEQEISQKEFEMGQIIDQGFAVGSRLQLVKQNIEAGI